MLSRQQIEEKLYGWNQEVANNAVEVHIHHLRKKAGRTIHPHPSRCRLSAWAPDVRRSGRDGNTTGWGWYHHRFCLCFILPKACPMFRRLITWLNRSIPPSPAGLAGTGLAAVIVVGQRRAGLYDCTLPEVNELF